MQAITDKLRYKKVGQKRKTSMVASSRQVVILFNVGIHGLRRCNHKQIKQLFQGGNDNMKIKEYKTSKTAKKTASENNLILADAITGKIKRLFDFSLLNDIIISDIEKEVIKEDAIKNITASNKVSFYGKLLDNFTACDGKANYYLHRVYNKDGKRLYDIYQLAKIEHCSKERKSVYDRYNITTYEVTDGYIMPVNDIEL